MRENHRTFCAGESHYASTAPSTRLDGAEIRSESYSIKVLSGIERESIRPSIAPAGRVARAARRGRANAPAKKAACRAINFKAMAPKGRQRSAPWASAAAATEIKTSTMAGITA
jgi:hypothetical protein